MKLEISKSFGTKSRLRNSRDPANPEYQADAFKSRNSPAAAEPSTTATLKPQQQPNILPDQKQRRPISCFKTQEFKKSKTQFPPIIGHGGGYRVT